MSVTAREVALILGGGSVLSFRLLLLPALRKTISPSSRGPPHHRNRSRTHTNSTACTKFSPHSHLTMRLPQDRLRTDQSERSPAAFGATYPFTFGEGRQSTLMYRLTLTSCDKARCWGRPHGAGCSSAQIAAGADCYRGAEPDPRT